MGGAQAAMQDDLGMLFGNPAGLAPLTRPSLSAHYSPGAQDTGSLFLAYGQPVGPVYLAAGWLQHQSRDIEVTDAAGNVLGQKDFLQQWGALSLATDALTPAVPLGLTVKYLESRFQPFSARGIGVDLGFQTQWKFLRFGAAWQDIGDTRLSGDGYLGGDAKDRVPSRIRTGVALLGPSPFRGYDPMAPRRAPLRLTGSLTVDARTPLDGDKDEALLLYGGEVWLERRLAVRAGWNEDRGFSAGASLLFRSLRLDYAFLMNENFDALNRFTTNLFFGKHPDDE